MRIRIDIECDTIADLLKHLAKISGDIKKEVENPRSFNLGDCTVFKESNCPGSHDCTIVS